MPGGAGGLKPPGIGGAPPVGAPPESLGFSTMGADLSLICVTFLSRAPFSMSPKSAPLPFTSFAAGLEGRLPGGGIGGGGGGPPAAPGMGGGGGGGGGPGMVAPCARSLVCYGYAQRFR